MSFMDQLFRFGASQIRGTFLIIAPSSLLNQWYSEAATCTTDMVAILYHGSAYDKDFLVQQEFFYTDHFMPKLSASKLKRQNITRVGAQNYYNDIYCRNCGLIIISFSLAD